MPVVASVRTLVPHMPNGSSILRSGDTCTLTHLHFLAGCFILLLVELEGACVCCRHPGGEPAGSKQQLTLSICAQWTLMAPSAKLHPRSAVSSNHPHHTRFGSYVSTRQSYGCGSRSADRSSYRLSRWDCSLHADKPQAAPGRQQLACVPGNASFSPKLRTAPRYPCGTR